MLQILGNREPKYYFRIRNKELSDVEEDMGQFKTLMRNYNNAADDQQQ